ncbi:thiaminase (transcriptional activator TenA) [Ruminococcus sp. YE71]|uniref:thiaminase II n=1 Tax=unclassified Ruminococcus TaxID=2608920 RepID=UPI00088F0CF2|nr:MULTISPECIES: thiaminase II [unclassified Ruminococcus]SDA16802.1 thiaminase (transcriptional activator TenA) [Ruminococcus sp. YE78]SFW25640.1 thiaminase (transcriptional activator TenA) [Ruminococcus sp. YE71]
MKVSERIYKAAMPIWETYYDHPFVKGIADGTLDKDKFAYYMVQDHKYLMQYAKVFALGVIRASKESDMRMFGSLISATLDTENAVHQSYLAKFGIDHDVIENTPMALNNESYTNYMISIGFKGGLAEIAAAVLACSWSYELIGEYIEKNYPNAKDNEFYGNWVNTYTSEGYRACNDEMIEMCDRFSEGLSEEQIVELENIVKICSKYEYQFWDMAWSKGDTYTP